MLRRNSKIAFGGMWVFPGGRIDATDRVTESDDDLACARRAAARETLEEVGLELNPDGLVPYAHWTPPASTPRRFETWFFVAPAPEGEVAIDQGEIEEHAWMRPTSALEQREAGGIELAVPTYVSLYDLAQFTGMEQVLAAVRTRTPERFATRIARVQDGAVAMWQTDAGYETQDPSLEGSRHRLWMLASGWRYEREPS